MRSCAAASADGVRFSEFPKKASVLEKTVHRAEREGGRGGGWRQKDVGHSLSLTHAYRHED